MTEILPPSPAAMYQKLQIVYDNKTNEERTRATIRKAPTLLSISRINSLISLRIINQTLPYRCNEVPQCCRKERIFPEYFYRAYPASLYLYQFILTDA